MRNMGGLRRYMPVTFATMWLATLAIAGVPPFAGFFSKDEILASVFGRANGSLLAQASLLGVPGSAWLYLFYGMGLLTALLTAIYMTRMMLYTFHGPNRTGGDLVRRHLHESPWTMTAPLVVLGVAERRRRVAQPPGAHPRRADAPARPLARAGGRRDDGADRGAVARDPARDRAVPGRRRRRGVALGIGFAVLRLRPAALVPKAQAPEEQGVERVLRDKFYVDEAYDAAIVRPTLAASEKVLYRGLDVGIIDRLFVIGLGWQVPRLFALVGSRLQSGAVGNYAWVLLIGVIVVLGAFTFR
jgi:NADH-quinone oxidoreductase subunit L